MLRSGHAFQASPYDAADHVRASGGVRPRTEGENLSSKMESRRELPVVLYERAVGGGGKEGLSMHTGPEAWSRLSSFRSPSCFIDYFCSVWYPTNERQCSRTYAVIPSGSSRKDIESSQVFSIRDIASRSYGWMFAEVVAFSSRQRQGE